MFEEIGVNPDTPTDRLRLRVTTIEGPPDVVPPLDRGPVLGGQYLRVEPDSAYEGATKVTVTVSRDRLQDRDASADELAIFRHSGTATDGDWERLDTTVTETNDDEVVVEAVADGMSVFAVGVVQDAIYELIADHKAVYNEHVDAVPGVFGSLFGGERIDLRVSRDDACIERIGVIMDGKRVQGVERGGLTGPTIVVVTSESTLRSVKNAEDPRAVALDALSGDAITYRGVGFGSTVKVIGMKTAIGVLDFVGETFGIGPFG